MKTLLLLGLGLLLAAASAAGPPSLAATIRAARWKKRVLLLAAPTADNADLQRQRQLLAAAPDGQARDLLVLEALPGQLSPADRQYLQREIGLKLTGFEVVLIGKDGGVKLRRPRPVAPAELFGLIDQMPMRRAEMRRQ